MGRCVLFVVVIVCALMASARAFTVCTVGLGGGGDFATLQAGLDGCNGGSGDIILRVDPSDIQIGPLVFPDTLSHVVVEPLTPGRIVVLGAGHFVDPLLSWTTLTLTNITWDAMGSSLAVFEPRLTNTNMTCMRCFYVNFNGSYVYRH